MKLLTWNVQWFLGLDGVLDVDRVLRHARQLVDFDVLCLQEVAVDMAGLAGGAPFDQAAAVARGLPGYEVFFTPAVNRWAGPGQPRACFGNLVATRLPALMVEHHPLPLLAEAGRPSVRRACTQVLVQAASGPLAIWNTHLEYHSGAQRALQIERILQLQRENAELVTASAVPGEPGLYQHIARSARSVLCGDFNCGSDSSEYRSLIRGEGEDALVDLFTQLHGDAPRPPTFGCFERRYVSQPLACDHVFATRNIAGLARSIAVDGLTRLSDHQPVYVHWEGL